MQCPKRPTTRSEFRAQRHKILSFCLSPSLLLTHQHALLTLASCGASAALASPRQAVARGWLGGRVRGSAETFALRTTTCKPSFPAPARLTAQSGKTGDPELKGLLLGTFWVGKRPTEFFLGLTRHPRHLICHNICATS